VVVVSLLRRLPVDTFLLSMLATLGLATLLPATGAAASVVDVATTVAVGLLFLLYGARLSPAQTWAGLRGWRLHVAVLGFTFLVFPAIGLALDAVDGALLSPELARGVLFLCLVPSTVQSAIVFTSMARGNVAGAIVSASVSNMLGVVLTPLLVVLLVRTDGGAPEVGLGAIGRIVLELLVPFVVGQALHRRIAPWLDRHARPTHLVERGSILLVIYSAFSLGMAQHIWGRITWVQVVALVGVCLLLLGVVMVLAVLVGRRLGFSWGDRVALLFCGSKKSLASGLPMASVLLGGGTLGMVVLPLMVFHQVQLIVCGILAPRLGRRAT